MCPELILNQIFIQRNIIHRYRRIIIFRLFELKFTYLRFQTNVSLISLSQLDGMSFQCIKSDLFLSSSGILSASALFLTKAISGCPSPVRSYNPILGYRIPQVPSPSVYHSSNASGRYSGNLRKPIQYDAHGALPELLLSE